MSQTKKNSEIFEKIAITEEEFEKVCADVWQHYVKMRAFFGELYGITTDGRKSPQRLGTILHTEQRVRQFMLWEFQDKFTAPDRFCLPQPDTQGLLIDGLPRLDGVWIGWNSSDFKSFESKIADLIFFVDIEKSINWHHPKLNKIAEISASLERFVPIIDMIDPLREKIAAFKMSCACFSSAPDFNEKAEDDLIMEITRLLGSPLLATEREVLWVCEGDRLVRLRLAHSQSEENEYQLDINIDIRINLMQWLPYQLESYGKIFYELCEAKINENKSGGRSLSESPG